MSVPSFLQSALWSYDLTKMDPDDPKDRDVIITQVLNHGNAEQLIWLTKTYTKQEIESVVKSPRRGVWFRRVLDYWLTIFGHTLPREQYQKAVFDLNPHAS